MNWILSYLTGRSQFVQINDKHSDSVNIQFGVPQGSILGPVLFNLLVNDLPNNHECSCFQYADDTTLYDHCSPRNLSACSNRMEATMSQLESWASQSNLLMNGDKTKQMLLTTPHMSKVHNLGEFIPSLSVGGQVVEKVKTFKLLGTWINENLKWSDNVKHVLLSCYGVLSTLRKIRNLAPQNVKKQLAECLVLSKLQFNDIVCYPLPMYLQKKIQKVQNCAASFVVNRYATEEDVLKLGWLPTKERTELDLLRATHHAMYNPSWPEYLKVEKREPKRLLRSSKAPLLVVPLTKGTAFQDSISRLFNELPAEIRSCSELPSYIRQVKDILKERAKERIHCS